MTGCRNKSWSSSSLRPDFGWVASPEILAEYLEVLRRPKFGLSDSLLAQWDERSRSAIAEWPAEVAVEFPRDAADAKFLACGAASDADFLITGDHDFTEARQIGRTKIISVSRFYDLVCKPLL